MGSCIILFQCAQAKHCAGRGLRITGGVSQMRCFRTSGAFDMKTQVEFRSSKFPPYEGEEVQINPGLWGKRLAEYLVQKLSERGIRTTEIIAEDWGWYIPIENEGFRLALCCGHQSGDDDEFLCFTDPSTPIMRSFFRKIDATAQLSKLTDALQQILSSDPDIRDIVWTEIG
jgi:hypothetical protein